MRLESLFHLSFYLTLALAAACLTLPSTFFLPWMPFFLAGAIILGYFAWKHEGAWVLSEMAANHLGVFIAIGAAGWILFQIPRSEEELILGGVNWPAGLLPHLGPLLVVLLIVKLFRPKRLPDFWVIQTMGLMMVTLAAVLADDAYFGALMLCYLGILVWCLMLYCPVRERLLAAAAGDNLQAPLFGTAADGPQGPLAWPLWALPRAARWTAVVAALGFVLFLVAPRQGQSQWNARQLSTTSQTSPRMSDLASIDLNRVGRVELSDEIAFTVTIRDRHGKVMDTGAVSRWRMETLEIYSGGRWFPVTHTKDLMMRRTMPPPLAPPAPSLPDALSDGERLVTFEVRPSLVGGLVLAEPVNVELGIGLGARVEDKDDAGGLFHRVEGCDTLAPVIHGRRRLHTYSQLMRMPADDVWQPAVDLNDEYPALLANQPAPESLRAWTHELLARLRGLDASEVVLDSRGRLAPVTAHARVAQALCRHLAQSGEYHYTLELRRKDRKLDPTTDFLMNVKEGHCERYAGGLALMLRVLGIRCRVVKGYLGLEMDEEGNGAVRLSQAHSWVQALVPGKEPNTWQWLTLDPTPASPSEDSVLTSWLQWCADNLLDSRGLWRSLIIDYTPDHQQAVLSALGRALISRPGVIVLVLLGCTYLAVRHRSWLGGMLGGFVAGRFLGPGRRAPAGFLGYEQLLNMMRRHAAMSPQRGQTPFEFATIVAAHLARQPETSAVAQVPLTIVTAHYEARYGQRMLDARQSAALQESLELLRQRLKMAKLL